MIENVRLDKGPCGHQWTCVIYKEYWKNILMRDNVKLNAVVSVPIRI